MSKAVKIWLIVAAALVLVGGIIWGGVMSVLQWDFTKLSTIKYETNEYRINETYQHISIKTNTADIRLMLSEDGSTSVVCHEAEDIKHTVTVKDGTLTIHREDTRKWYRHIGVSIGSPTVTVYVPEGVYGALSVESGTGKVEISRGFTFESMDIDGDTGDVVCQASVTGNGRIKTDTGHITVQDMTAGELVLSVSTGKVKVSNITCDGDLSIKVSTGRANVTDVTCDNLISHGNTGDLTLTNVVSDGAFTIERSTGDVKMEACDAATLTVETDTGNVTGSLLTDKIFMCESDTGWINVPKTVQGGVCEITTNTGNIRIHIAE